MRNLLIPEILDLIRAATTKEQKVAILRQNRSPALEIVLKTAFDPASAWYRNTVPAYKADPAPAGMSFGNLSMEAKKFYVFLASSTVRTDKKDSLLIQMLESIHPSESKLVESLITRTFADTYLLNKAIVKEAFPGVLPDEPVTQPTQSAPVQPKPSEPAPVPVQSVEQPVKRGRGRPRKNPAPPAAS